MVQNSKPRGLMGLLAAPFVLVSREWKAVGAVLVAVLVAVAIGQIGNLVYEPEELEEHAYAPVEVTVAAQETDDSADEVEAIEPIGPLLADADAAAGEQVASRCTACHTFDEGGGARVGPNLFGIVGRAKAADGGFNYSEALAELDGVWDEEALNAFFVNPQEYAPGTRMGFAGLSAAGDRADLIAYMSAGAGGGAAAEETTDETEATEEVAVVLTLAERIAAADPAAGEAVARQCSGCHSMDQGGATRVGPNLFGIVGDTIATREGFTYSDAIAGLGGDWTYEALDGYLEAPRAYAPGTRMGFAGIADADDRAALIAYLRSNDDDPAPLP